MGKVTGFLDFPRLAEGYVAPAERVKNYKINVQKIDVDTNSDLTSQFGIRNIPTVVLVNEMGEEHTRITGVQSVEKYVSVYESFDMQK